MKTMIISHKLPVFLCLILAGLPAFGLNLPADAEADRLLLAAESAIQSDNHREARGFLVQAQALNTALPNQFYFLYGTALFHLDEHKTATTNLIKFVETAERGSPEYNKALSLLTAIEKKEGQRKSTPNKQETTAPSTTVIVGSEEQYVKGITQLYLSSNASDALLKHINSMLSSHALQPPTKIIKPGQRALLRFRLSHDRAGNLITSSQKMDAFAKANSKSIVSTTKMSVFGVDPFVTYRCSSGTNSCWLRSPVNGSQWIEISNNEQATAEISRAITALIKILQKGNL